MSSVLISMFHSVLFFYLFINIYIFFMFICSPLFVFKKFITIHREWFIHKKFKFYSVFIRGNEVVQTILAEATIAQELIMFVLLILFTQLV